MLQFEEVTDLLDKKCLVHGHSGYVLPKPETQLFPFRVVSLFIVKYTK